MTDKTHTVNESADKIVLTTKVKRGTGTRDQDEIKIKVKGDNPTKAAKKLHNTVLSVNANDTVNELRDTQPEQ